MTGPARNLVTPNAAGVVTKNNQQRRPYDPDTLQSHFSNGKTIMAYYIDPFTEPWGIIARLQSTFDSVRSQAFDVGEPYRLNFSDQWIKIRNDFLNKAKLNTYDTRPQNLPIPYCIPDYQNLYPTGTFDNLTA